MDKELLISYRNLSSSKKCFEKVKYSRVVRIHGRKVAIVNKRNIPFNLNSYGGREIHGTYDFKTGVLINTSKLIKNAVSDAITYIGNRIDEFHQILIRSIPINEPEIQIRYMTMKRMGLEEVILKELLDKYPKTK